MIYKKLDWHKHSSGVVHAHPPAKNGRPLPSLCGKALAGTPLEIGVFEMYCEKCKYSDQNGEIKVTLQLGFKGGK